MTRFDEAPSVLTVSQAAELLQIGRAQAYSLIHSEGFPAFFVGRYVRISRDALKDWVEEQSRKATI